MNPQFLIAKLAANATDMSWSQAYSTLNFYVALSVSSREPSDTPLAQTGKDTLEKLQREYFSLDEKTIESIKLAVENTVSQIDSSITYSLILVTNTFDTLLIITAEEGIVAIKRGDKLGVIAKGEKGSVLSFSGPLNHHDIIIVETADFAKKIPNSTLAPLLDTINVTDISENIAPHIHREASGGEAAIVLLYTNPDITEMEEAALADTDIEEKDLPAELQQSESSMENDVPTESKNEAVEEKVTNLNKPLSNTKPALPFPFIPRGNMVGKLKEKRKMVIGVLILILLIVLIGTIFFRTRTETSAQNGEAINQAYVTAQSEYDEGIALEPLNRPLALDKFNSAHKTLTDTKNKFPNDSEIDRVTTLLSKVEQKLSEFSSGTKVENGEKLVSKSDLDIDAIHTVSVKGGTLFVTDKANTLVTLSESGEVEETYDTDTSTIIDVTANDEFAFILTSSGVQRINLESGSANELFELDKARQAIEIFGSNIYLLDTSNNMVEKYAPSSYTTSDYLTEPLSKKGNRLAIDGSVYVLYEDGTINKFTRGAEDTFSISALQGKIGQKSYIYTEESFTNLYILDTGNQRLLVISQTGEVKQEFSWDIFKNATDFAINEIDKTIYIATPQDLYQFTF